MDTLTFLDQMASRVHHHKGLNDLIDAQPSQVNTAYQSNKGNLLREYLGEAEFVANPTDVIQLALA